MTNAADVIQALREACIEAGSQKDWAITNDFNPSFVSDGLKGRREVTDRLGAALGYKFVGEWKRV